MNAIVTTSLAGVDEPPEAFAFARRLADGDPWVRRLALLELAELEEDTNVPRFIAALKSDTSAEVRTEAARVLAAWEREDAVGCLCEALTDESPEVRNAAAASLAELKNAHLGPVLLRWVGHETAFVRASALRGLRELRVPESYQPALNALCDDSAGVRREGVAVLGWLKRSDALPQLASVAAGDPDTEVRRAATGALGMAADASVHPALVSALVDRAWQVREEAAATLGRLRIDGVNAALSDALADEFWQVRVQAARALGRLKAHAAVDALAMLLSHPIGNVRKEAALALGEIGATAALLPLQDAAKDPDPDVRKAARISISQIERATGIAGR